MMMNLILKVNILYFIMILGHDDIESDDEEGKETDLKDVKIKDNPHGSHEPKTSFSKAILDILNGEEKEGDEKCPILSKNSRPFKLLEKEKKRERDEKNRLHEKDQVRKQGRCLPCKEEAQYERNLQMIATKGVVRLFNAVFHQQSENRRDAAKDVKIREDFVSKKLEMDKSKLNSNDTILKKIISKEKKWQVFDDGEEEDEGENE